RGVAHVFQAAVFAFGNAHAANQARELGAAAHRARHRLDAIVGIALVDRNAVAAALAAVVVVWHGSYYPLPIGGVRGAGPPPHPRAYIIITPRQPSRCPS